MRIDGPPVDLIKEPPSPRDTTVRKAASSRGSARKKEHTLSRVSALETSAQGFPHRHNENGTVDSI